MKEALVNNEILKWARLRCSYDLSLASEKIGVPKDKLEAWENGIKKPTFNQAINIANKYRIPFGYLFLKQPPNDNVAVPDLRTLNNASTPNLSADFKELILDIEYKHNWYVNYLKEQNILKIPFVARFKNKHNFKTIAHDIVNVLKIDDNLRKESKTSDSYFSKIVIRMEECGIWVIKTGIIKNNTHKSLSVEEFRGFAICHEYAPLIFINSKDANAAQIFTLIHEAAHIWIGESGITDLSIQALSNSFNKVEILCNKIAGEVLVPEESIKKNWNKNEEISANISKASSYYKVSKVVIAKRAYDLELINLDQYTQIYNIERQKWVKKTKTGSGNIWMNYKNSNGSSFSKTVVSQTLEGKILYSEASKLLNVNSANIDKFASFLGIKK